MTTKGQGLDMDTTRRRWNEVTSGGNGERMRVAVVTETFLPSLNGVTTSVQRLLEHLAHRGHEAAVFCPGPAPESYAGFPVFEAPSFDVRGFRAAVPNRRTMKQILDWAPDVMHVAAPMGLGSQALSLAKKYDIPSVAVFQTDVARYTSSYGLPLLGKAAWRWIRNVHAKADLNLAPASKAVDDLEALGLSGVKTWAGGADTVTYHPNLQHTEAVQALRDRLAPNGEVLVGYVGRLAPEKKLHLLKGVTKVDGARLVIVGDGPERDNLERELAGTNAVFLGPLQGTELAEAYAALGVFVHTGTQETFGLTLQEAMATGLPVLAPAIGGPLDIVDDGVTGFLLPPLDEQAITEATSRLVQEPGLRAQMGEAGRRAVLPRSWSAIGDQILGHYRQAIEASATLPVAAPAPALV